MAKFTPGPWEYEVDLQEAGKNLILEFQSVIIGGERRIRMTGENAEANARLIAAAPEMYEALKELIGGLELATHNELIEMYIDPYGVINNAKRVLAKAEGKDA